jgi:PAS domain S-box-containing protein
MKGKRLLTPKDMLRLKYDEATLSLLADNAPIGICIIQDGRFVMVNPVVEDTTGYSAQELLGRESLSIVSPDHRAMVRKRAIQNLKRKKRFLYEFQFITKEGRTGWSSGKVLSIYYQEKRAILGYFIDITPYKKLETEFLQAQKIEVMGRLAIGVAHDLNNILTSIIGNIELSRLCFSDDSPCVRYLEDTLTAVQKATSLTRQLTTFSSRQMLQPQIINLNSVVTNLAKMLQRLIGEDIELILALDPDLGVINIDPGQIEQILLNLAVNARDAMPLGGSLTLETSNVQMEKSFSSKLPLVSPGNYVMVKVSDTGMGMGMDKEILSHISESFFTAKEMGKGTGLGLPTVFRIIKQSGGHIELDSTPGMGTTFKIYFPRAEKVVREKRKPTLPGLLQGPETILLVEDDDSLRGVIANFLKKCGYSVLEAMDCNDAVLICEKYKSSIHLMLTDIVMPQLSGLELAEVVASYHPETKVIYMSGRSERVAFNQNMLQSLTFIQKPFKMADLLLKIRTILDALPDK